MFYETKGPISNNVSWSNKEIEEWEKLGLIPCDFLLPENITQLIKFIIENKELLYAAYHDPIEDYPHLVELPAPERLHETYELRVIDKRTGEVVKILDRMETFEICDDVSLHIKSAEKNPWEEKIASVKKLTKDQKNYLKDVLSKLSDNGQKQININDLVQAIEEIIKETKTATYSVSGKFVDQKVPTQQRLLLQQIDKKTEIKVYGIRRLSPSEHRITKTISLLLHKNNSQGCGPKIEGFAGLDTGKLLKNELLQKVYGSPPSIIMIDEDEYFEAYWGNTEYGGSDRNFMTTGLKDFSRREFPVNVDHIYQINGQELTDRLELSSSMAEVYYFYPSLTTEEKKKLNKGNSKTRRPKRKMILVINQIFTDEIEYKFIKYPIDINRRLSAAAGSSNKVTSSMHLLLDYLLREISNRRYKDVEIGEDKLITLLELDNLLKQGKRKVLNDTIEKTFKAMKNLGVLKGAEKARNKTGGFKFIFQLNENLDW